MTKSALIVIDLQNDYFPGGKWTLDGINAAKDKATALIDASRKAGHRVIFVRHEFASADAPFFAPGTKGAEIHADLTPSDSETVVLKHKVNSFHQTDLKDVLDADDVDSLVICGAMSHMCVDGATRAASDLGYACTVIHDACASRDLEFNGVTVPAKQAHAAFMSALGFAYANVISADEYLKAMAEAALSIPPGPGTAVS